MLEISNLQHLYYSYPKLIKLFIIGILSLMTLALLFANIQNQEVLRWDEFTNIQVVSELDSIDLKISGEPFLEKPPIWYYFTKISENILGENILSYRLVSIISGSGLIVVTFLIARKLYGFKAGIFAWLNMIAIRIFFISDDLVFHTLRTADLDALFLFLTSLSLFFFISQTKLKYIILGSIFSALAFLTKGPVGLIPIFVVFAFEIIDWKKTNSNLNISKLLYLLLPAIIISCIWFIFITLSFQELFLQEFIGYHLISRGVVSIEGHSNSLLNYLILFTPIYSGLSFIGFLVFKNLKILNSREFILLGYLIINIVILILIQTKLGWYILPVLPVLSIFTSKIIISSKRIYLYFFLLTSLILIIVNIIIIFSI